MSVAELESERVDEWSCRLQVVPVFDFDVVPLEAFNMLLMA